VSTPAITVVIPVYNRAQLLQCAIESVLAQTFSDYEMIVVDDGSTDDLNALVPGLHHPRVRYVRQANQGVAAARNNAFGQARGAELVFLDSDDALMPRGLELLHNGLAANPAAAIAYGWAMLADHDGYISQRTRPTGKGRAWRQYLYTNPTPPATLMVRRKVLESGYDFDTTLAGFEDWDFCLRLSWHYDFVCVPAFVAQMTSQPVQRSSSQTVAVVGDVMRTMYAKLARDPESAPVADRYSRRLQANVHVMMGHQYRLFVGNPWAARQEYLTALRLAPTFGRAYIGLAESLLGPGAIRKLRTMRSRLYTSHMPQVDS
jgi:glycosyltransferase involved in cell wall biosynthesis